MYDGMIADMPYEDQFHYQTFLGVNFFSGGLFSSDSNFSYVPSCSSCSLNSEVNILRCEKAYWQKMHQKALAREAGLKKELDEVTAKLRLREQQLFGRKSEKNSGKNEKAKQSAPKRNRGQQKASKGHGRRDYDHLPAEE